MSLHATYIIILAGLVSLTVCLIMTPVIIRFTTKRGVVDKPDERKCHTHPIPQLGGTAVVSGIIAAVFVCFPFLPKEIRPDEIYAVMGISLGACLSFIIGLFDDLFGLKPGNASQGPTPLVYSLTITVQDLPDRDTLNFPNHVALAAAVASALGNYEVRGDANGIIPIQSVTVTNNPLVNGQPATATIVLSFAQPLRTAEAGGVPQ